MTTSAAWPRARSIVRTWSSVRPYGWRAISRSRCSAATPSSGDSLAARLSLYGPMRDPVTSSSGTST
jgi:hypothetical protein